MDNNNSDNKKTPIGVVSPKRKWRPALREEALSRSPKQVLSSEHGMPSSDSRVHVLFMRTPSHSSDLLEQKLKDKGFVVTNVFRMVELKEEWQLGVHDLILVDDSIAFDERLFLLQTATGQRRPMPTVMIFPPGNDHDALLMMQRGAVAAIVTDDEGEYLTRIPNIIGSFTKENDLIATREISYARLDFSEETKEIDLKTMAIEVRGETIEVQVALLIVSHGPDLGKSVTLGGDLCVIGRDLACQLTLSDDSISRFHVSAKRLPNGEVFVKDLDSTNGTFYKGERITSAKLKNNDQIYIGHNTVISIRLPVGQK